MEPLFAGSGLEFSRPNSSQLRVKGPLTPEQIEQFFSDGFVVARNLLSPEIITQLHQGVGKIERMENGPCFDAYDRLQFNVFQASSEFKKVGINSPVSAAISQLMPPSDGPRGLVVLNGVYFRFSGDNIGCGYHVDDDLFWPCPRDAPGPGVNAWIPLDSVRSKHGGGLIVVPKSFDTDFIPHRQSIRGAYKTCSMAQDSPKLNDDLEKKALELDFEPGDVLFHTRFLFHRTSQFKECADDHVKKQGVRRYTIRYMPGNAMTIPTSFENSGLVMDKPIKLSRADEEKYPAVLVG